MNTEVMFSSKTDEWETPQSLFDELDKEFHFDLDVAANEKNAKCANFLDKSKNGLNWKWGRYLLDESSLWQRNRQMGKEGLRRKSKWLYSGMFTSCQNGHKMVPLLHIRQSGDSIHKR
jgi:hypothetical protein